MLQLIEELEFIISDTPEGEISENELQRYRQVQYFASCTYKLLCYTAASLLPIGGMRLRISANKELQTILITDLFEIRNRKKKRKSLSKQTERDQQLLDLQKYAIIFHDYCLECLYEYL